MSSRTSRFGLSMIRIMFFMQRSEMKDWLKSLSLEEALARMMATCSTILGFLLEIKLNSFVMRLKPMVLTLSSNLRKNLGISPSEFCFSSFIINIDGILINELLPPNRPFETMPSPRISFINSLSVDILAIRVVIARVISLLRLC